MTEDPRKDQEKDPRQPPPEEGRREAERLGGTRRKMPERPRDRSG